MTLTNRQKEIGIILLFVAVAIALWNTPVIYPIKLFVVMLHEMSHGLMAIIFGGEIIEIQIDQRVGGYCRYTVPSGFFSRFMIASAGYLGSLFWGVLILIFAIRTNYDRHISLIIGIFLMVLSWFVIKNGELFGIIVTLGFGLFMLVSYKVLPDKFHDYFLKFIGITSCHYVVLDIKSDLIDRTGIGSDADAIADMVGIPSILVGVIWFVIAIVVMWFALKYAFKPAKA